MQKRRAQAPSAAVMIRPHHFRPNPETQGDNAFQSRSAPQAASELKKRAFDEVSRAATALREAGVRIDLFEDEEEQTPDSVFPNNWFSTHPDGDVAIYPMFTPNRRLERRNDIIEMLKREFRVRNITDYSGLEQDGLYLEGTGAMVLDYIGRIAYVARSNRSSQTVLERFCAHFNYEPVVFAATGRDGAPVYHTNVMMCIATEFALIGADMIEDRERADGITRRLGQSGREVVALNIDQIENFAGNAIELQGKSGRILAISARAVAALRREQLALIENSVEIVPLAVPTIELAGGSVRCMLASNHLAPRN